MVSTHVLRQEGRKFDPWTGLRWLSELACSVGVGLGVSGSSTSKTGC